MAGLFLWVRKEAFLCQGVGYIIGELGVSVGFLCVLLADETGGVVHLLGMNIYRWFSVVNKKIRESQKKFGIPK